MNTSRTARNIEKDIERRWGWKIKVNVSKSGHVSWDGKREINKDRYDMYPGMSQQQADDTVMSEILVIIQKYIPGFQYISYEQSGKMHYPQTRQHDG